MEFALVLIGLIGPVIALIAIALGAEVWDALTPLVVVLVLAGLVAVFV